MLNSQVGQDRKSTPLYTTVIEGDFITPTLTFSEKRLYFKYSWLKGVPFAPIAKQLEITCSCQQPVNFNVKINL